MPILAYLSNLDMGGGGGAAPVVATQPVAGGSGKRIWVEIGERFYRVYPEDVPQLLAAYIALQEGDEVELPESKPAPIRVKPKASKVARIKVPDIPYKGFDWEPLYRMAMVQREAELAKQWEAAIRQRMDDDDDAAVLMLLH